MRTIPPPDMERARSQVCAVLGYHFKETNLLDEALTHRSFRHENEGVTVDNERLEFLGDAIVEWLASDLLWYEFPGASEGELTQRRADLVCATRLAELSQALGFDKVLLLGKGEEKQGARENKKILSSAVEAIVGALYLDAGAPKCKQVFAKILKPWISRQAPASQDYKSRLQAVIQGARQITPTYRITHTEGPEHQKRFFVEVLCGVEVLAKGEGASKSEAERAAAERALDDIGLNRITLRCD